MADLPDFLSDEPSSTPDATAAPAAPSEAPAAAPEAAPASPPEGVSTPPAQAAPAAPQPEAPAHAVPLTTFLDVRDKLSAAEKEAKELREWRQQQEEAARRRPPPEAPDPQEDPVGYAHHQRETFGQMMFEQARDSSRRFAELQHGKDLVDQAWEWAASQIDDDLAANRPSPLNLQVQRSRDPAGFVVEEFRKHQMLSEVSSLSPDDLAAFHQWRANQQPGQPGAAPQAAAPAAPPASPAPPRASIAAAPSAGANGGTVPRDGAATFDAMFSS